MFQKVTLIGRVGQDPQMRFTPDGTPVVNISVATTETISKRLASGGERPCPQGWKESYNGRNWEVTTWWRITAWRGLAETINEFVTQGQQLFIEGVIQGQCTGGTCEPRIWSDNNGQARCSFELTARTVKFLSRPNGTAAAKSPEEDDYRNEPLPF